MRSSPHRATVHRTVAFRWVRVLYHTKKKRPPGWVGVWQQGLLCIYIVKALPERGGLCTCLGIPYGIAIAAAPDTTTVVLAVPTIATAVKAVTTIVAAGTHSATKNHQTKNHHGAQNAQHCYPKTVNLATVLVIIKSFW